MEGSDNQKQNNKKITQAKTVTVPFALGEIKNNISICTNSDNQSSKEQLMNQAFKFHSQGNIQEAAKYYQDFINQGFNDHRVFSNYGIILNKLEKLEEAELSIRKAIELKPDFADAHSNLGSILCNLGKLQEAEFSYRKAIELNPDLAKAHYNLGSILSDLGKLQEAELSTRKAIELNPDLAKAHYNLGNILRDLELNPDLAKAHYNLGYILSDLGKLQEAQFSYRKAIELNPDLAKAYYSLSLHKNADNNQVWQDQLFSRNILKDKLPKEKIDIYFARANILHKEKKYEDSSKCLHLANNLKLELKPSNSDTLINKSRTLLIESDQKKLHKKEHKSSSENIFIVGMFRSGSTLLESILSMRDDVYDLGEINILEESFLEYKKSKQEINLTDLYRKKINNKTKLNISTNKWLYNYQYAGIIAQHIANAKIIHCYRHPLDNILSIFRGNFTKGNEYSSSLIDCARVYLDQEEIMSTYKNRFRSKIYDLNYDSLVKDPNIEIKSLISWLGWKWDNIYLSPHLNPRSVLTASNVQVRSPINSQSIGGWKNYRKMLKPSIEILAQTDRYRYLIS